MIAESIISGQDRMNLAAKGYLTAAFWTNGEDEEIGDKTFYDIELESLQVAMAEVVTFVHQNEEILESSIEECDSSWEQVGHDLWLNRNGHGSGFWDGDWPEEAGKKLDEAATAMGESTMYVGDDGKVYFM